MSLNFYLLSFILFISNPCYSQLLQADPKIKAPSAEKKSHVLENFGDKRIDNYYWLKERKNKKVLSYLNAENKYFEKVFKPALSLQKSIYNEIRGRIKEDESTFPLKKGNYLYYTRYELGQEYPIYSRKQQQSTKEEILFDVNKFAKNKDYYQAEITVSPNHNRLALIADEKGRRFYDISFKDLKTKKFLPHKFRSVTDNLIWANDNKTVYFVKQDPKTLRAYQVYAGDIETGKQLLVYEEKDDTFEVYISTSLIRKHLFINCSSTLSSEVRTLSLTENSPSLELIWPREKAHEYSVSEDDKYFYILTNKNAKNFQILKLPLTRKSTDEMETVVAHRDDTFIDNFLVFENNISLATHQNALTQIEVYNKSSGKMKKLNFLDTAYSVEFGANAEYDANNLRYVYQSLRNPPSVYDYDFKTEVSQLRKTKEVPNFKMDLYQSDRIMVKARDGEVIPVSILMKKGTPLNGSAPILIYGYGAYGSNLDPWFSVTNLSLVDRGFIYAIAHIRGGGERGRTWTEDGRTLKKMNTFNDFIDVTEHLINHHYASKNKVFAMGASAGGLLIGAIANMRPELYRGLIAEVPFVDVLTTMLDDSIPLTTFEYDEWGNPNLKEYYHYIKTYSPYDNVTQLNYPNILVTTGLHDSQVQYWEPAKWVARIREENKSKNLILLKTDMNSGHGGRSGRFEQIDESALNFAFILGLL